MTFFPDSNTFLNIAGISIRWYAVTLLLGLVAAYFFLGQRLKRHGYTVETLDEVMVLCLIGGLIGGRVIWVLENLREYMKYVPYMFAISDGGFDIVGVAAGISVILFPYSIRRHMSILRLMDTLMPALYIFMIVTRAARAIASPGVWIVEAIDFAGLVVMYFYLRKYRPGRRRGDLAAFGFMWLGLSRLIGLVAGLDPYAQNGLVGAVVVEVMALALYIIIRQRRPTMPIVLFDLDGTLMDSEAMVIACFTYLFKKYSDVRLFTEEKKKEVFGPPLREEMIRLFPDQDPDQMVKEYQRYQSSFSWRDEVGLFPYVKETLDVLYQEGYQMGIVSSRLTGSCESWVKQLGLSSYFEVILGRDQYQREKPYPDGILYAGRKMKRGHDSCIYIGDNVSDVESARAAGVYAICYLSDKTKLEEIKAAHPNRIIKKMSDVLRIIDEDHEWSYERV